MSLGSSDTSQVSHRSSQFETSALIFLDVPLAGHRVMRWFLSAIRILDRGTRLGGFRKQVRTVFKMI